MDFKEFLEGSGTGAKLGLYPDLADALGQYPPLYVTPRASDFITYFDIEYGKNPLKFWAPGIVNPEDMKRIEKKSKRTSTHP